jgi:DNA-binding MurR/RpiR family transcriptional regulator
MEKHLRTLANFAAQEAAKLEKQRKKIMDAKSKIREYDSTAIVNDDCMVVVHSVTGYTGETVQILKTVKEYIKDMKKKEKENNKIAMNQAKMLMRLL